MKTLLLSFALLFLLSGCAPKSIVTLSETSSIINVGRVMKTEEGIRLNYTVMSVTGGWTLWPSRANTRWGGTLLYVPQGDRYLVKKHDGPRGVALYRGNTSVGHGEPDWHTPSEWVTIGTTADLCPEKGGPPDSSGNNPCFYVELWDYVTKNFHIDLEAEPETHMAPKSRGTGR